MFQPSEILRRAAFIANRYDRDAKGDLRFNLTPTFHLCGLIERAATIPKSGATHRRYIAAKAMEQAKAQFCRAHRVVHPSMWEWEQRRTPCEVRDALLTAA